MRGEDILGRIDDESANDLSGIALMPFRLPGPCVGARKLLYTLNECHCSDYTRWGPKVSVSKYETLRPRLCNWHAAAVFALLLWPDALQRF